VGEKMYSYFLSKATACKKIRIRSLIKELSALQPEKGGKPNEN